MAMISLKISLLAFIFLLSKILADNCYNPKNQTFVRTKAGWLKGKIIENSGSSYLSYKGIPYAEPPIGKLRFQAPVPKAKWQGVREAFEHGSSCPYRWGDNNLPGGSEDCLFLNVYTPSLQGKRSAMVWFHAGGYIIGNGDSTLHGPEHLMKEDVVLVTLNYRYSAFGFLSTNDEHAPGNNGLKDKVLALKWIQQNIKKFGGNPDDVTIFGQSAGSVSVHYLLISDLTKGLFHKAIMESGTSLMPALFQPDPRTQAETLGRRLNIEFNSTKDLVEKLQAVDYMDIVNVESPLFAMGKPWALRPFEFVPCVEPKNVENAFLTETPIQRMLKGKFHKVPLILGSQSFEGMFAAGYFLGYDQNGVKDYNSHSNFIVPISLELNETSKEFSDVVSELQNLYFEGRSEGSLLEWLNVYSDGFFTLSVDRVARFYSATRAQSIYYYQFAFSGTLNFYKTVFGLQSFDGACHGDELLYLFEPGFPGFEPDEKSGLIRSRMTKMWSNFAKYGNPTPEKTTLLPITWESYDLNKRSYFVIDEKLENLQNFPRMDFYNNLYQKYTGHY